ncbi:MAG: hypothetical protein JO033_07530 [Acidobacteriaceae bacterium]|nr:hypothetical protein [Acidobacteriaceae bacterium]MBV9502433.1 hypothetical protein [Acidobacteriaceae bacterium]
MTRRQYLLWMATATGTFVSCGYHVGGKADLMPKSIQTISIPTFSTLSTRYRLVDLLPRDIAREFNERTRFRIVSNPAEADAVLNGTINTVAAYPTIFDPASGKASVVQITMIMTITLHERATGRVLYSRANWAVRENYQIAINPRLLFDESTPAFDRLSRDAARDIVTSVVENF